VRISLPAVSHSDNYHTSWKQKESVCCWCRRRLTAALLHLANDAQFASVTFQIDLQHRLISCSTPHHLHLSYVSSRRVYHVMYTFTWVGIAAAAVHRSLHRDECERESARWCAHRLFRMPPGNNYEWGRVWKLALHACRRRRCALMKIDHPFPRSATRPTTSLRSADVCICMCRCCRKRICGFMAASSRIQGDEGACNRCAWWKPFVTVLLTWRWKSPLKKLLVSIRIYNYVFNIHTR
jgi:hypothetical protein